jgi:hypothetical protein
VPESQLKTTIRLFLWQLCCAEGAVSLLAAILGATANLENAKTEAAQLKREQLLPEEQALVESLL